MREKKRFKDLVDSKSRDRFLIQPTVKLSHQLAKYILEIRKVGDICAGNARVELYCIWVNT